MWSPCMYDKLRYTRKASIYVPILSRYSRRISALVFAICPYHTQVVSICSSSSHGVPIRQNNTIHQLFHFRLFNACQTGGVAVTSVSAVGSGTTGIGATGVERTGPETETGIEKEKENEAETKTERGIGIEIKVGVVQPAAMESHTDMTGVVHGARRGVTSTEKVFWFFLTSYSDLLTTLQIGETVGMTETGVEVLETMTAKETGTETGTQTREEKGIQTERELRGMGVVDMAGVEMIEKTLNVRGMRVGNLTALPLSRVCISSI
jgi:hypothetical protein